MSALKSIEDYVKELTRPAKILLVEDDKEYCELFRLLTRDYNREVTFVTSGQDGIDQYASTDYDITFLDVHLPDMQGMEVFKTMKGMVKTCPIVIMTGILERETVISFLKYGFTAFVEKPANFNKEFINDLFASFRIAKKQETRESSKR